MADHWTDAIYGVSDPAGPGDFDGMAREDLAKLRAENAALQSRLTEMEARETVYRKALDRLRQAFILRHGCYPVDVATVEQREWNAAMAEADNILVNPSPGAARLLDMLTAMQKSGAMTSDNRGTVSFIFANTVDSYAFNDAVHAWAKTLKEQAESAGHSGGGK